MKFFLQKEKEKVYLVFYKKIREIPHILANFRHKIGIKFSLFLRVGFPSFRYAVLPSLLTYFQA